MNETLLATPVRSAIDVTALSSDDRAQLTAWLADATRCQEMSLLSQLPRRAALAMTAGAAVFLVPWIAVLSTTLPDHHSAHQWRLAWSGFDVALTLAFAAAAWAGWRRRQIAVTALTVLGVLLVCDAWFDVALSWGTSEQAASIVTAVIAELPLAAIVLLLANRLLHEATHYIWHLEGHDDPPPPLHALPLIFLPPAERPRR